MRCSWYLEQELKHVCRVASRHLSWNRARSQRVVVRGQMNSKASRFETIEFNIVLQASKSEACCNAVLHVSKVLGFMI